MLAYAASRPRIGARHSSPNLMLAIIALHVGALAVLMSAKMDLPQRIRDHGTQVTFIPIPQPPPPNQRVRQPQSHQTSFTRTDPQVPVPLPGPIAEPVPTDPMATPWPTRGFEPQPLPNPQPLPVRIAARLLTPMSELRPPYPQSKLLAEEEATLRLRLTIDERGRVIAVEPIAPADPAFFDAARRYLIAHWRYRPASEDGRAMTSTEVITLRFQLDG
jgi:periplasmic protein TonB